QMLATRPENYRRIMLILSEARDRGSHVKLGAAMEQVQRSGVVVYTGTYSAMASSITSSPDTNPPQPAPAGDHVDFPPGIPELMRLGKTNAADALARATGGRHIPFLTLNSLEDALTRTGEEIHSQYLLSFVPTDPRKKGFHQIQVALPKHPDALIRVRAGY